MYQYSSKTDLLSGLQHPRKEIGADVVGYVSFPKLATVNEGARVP